MKKKVLSTAICGVLGATTAVVVMPGVVLAQQQKAEEKREVEEVYVTGSRIKRTELDASAQLVTLEKEDIDLLAVQNISDVLRSSPLNTLGSFNERSGSSAQSNAYIDLRGLGDSRTLVLVNGRRMTGSPNAGASSININMVPMAAVGRVEIMADGGSATYGSDAVAGVVNMYFRDDFEGLEFSYHKGERSEDDGSEEAFSVIGGAQGDDSSLVFSAEWSRRSPIFDGDRSYTAPWVRDNDGDGIIEAYVDTDGYSLYGSSIWLYDEVTGYDQILASTSCPEAGGVWLGEVDANTDWGGSTGNDTYCMYGYGYASANKASLDRVSMYASGSKEIIENHEFYASAIFSRVESFGRFAPPAATWDNMPEDYADVPFDIEALLDSGDITEGNYTLTGLYRWTNIGTRDNEVTDLQFDFSAGVRGDITDSINYDFYVQNSQYTSKEFGYYYLSNLGLDYVFAQGIDPFSPEGAGAMRATTTQDNFTKMRKVYGHVQFSLGDLFGGGEVLALVGAERFDTHYQNLYDSHSESELVGGSAGNSSNGSRDVTAFFTEAVLPVTDTIEVNASLRYDSYSDFGSEVSPAVSATWGVTDDLMLRSRVSHGFRAPSLDQLYGPDTFSAESTKDYVRCAAADPVIPPEDCPATQLDTYFSTNPDLDAETSQTFSVGANYQFIEDWYVDAGYWSVTIEDVITLWYPQELIYAELAGVDLDNYPGLVVDRPTPGGRPTAVYSTYVNNKDDLQVSGVDLKVYGDSDTSLGVFGVSAFISKQFDYDEFSYPGARSSTDKTGYHLYPSLRAQLATSWTMGDHSVGWIVDYIHSHSSGNSISQQSLDAGFPRLTSASSNLDSWTTHTIHYGYDAGAFGKVKVGARNAFNKDPVLDGQGKYSADLPDLYDNTGRVWFLDYTIAFD